LRNIKDAASHHPLRALKGILNVEMTSFSGKKRKKTEKKNRDEVPVKNPRFTLAYRRVG